MNKRNYKPLMAVLIALIMLQCTGKQSQQNQTQLDVELADESVQDKKQVKNDSLPEIEEVKQSETEGGKESDCLLSLLQYNTRELLGQQFGNENLQDTVMWFEEGTVKKEVVFLNRCTDDELRFAWGENGLEIACYSLNAKWTAHKVKCGTTLKQLIDLNEEHFIFYGFGSCGGGTTFIEKGKLAGKNLQIEVDPTDKCPNRFEHDIEFSTQDLNDIELNNIVVRRFIVK